MDTCHMCTNCTGLYVDFCLCSRGTIRIPSSLAVSTFSDPVVMFSGSGQCAATLTVRAPSSLARPSACRMELRVAAIDGWLYWEYALTPPALDLAIALPPLFLRAAASASRGASVLAPRSVCKCAALSRGATRRGCGLGAVDAFWPLTPPVLGRAPAPAAAGTVSALAKAICPGRFKNMACCRRRVLAEIGPRSIASMAACSPAVTDGWGG